MEGDDHVYSASVMTKVEGALMGLVPESVQQRCINKLSKPLDE